MKPIDLTTNEVFKLDNKEFIGTKQDAMVDFKEYKNQGGEDSFKLWCENNLAQNETR